MSYPTFSGNLRVERVRFSNDNGWTVASVNFVDGPPLDAPPVGGSFALVGSLGRVNAGDVLRVTGDWDKHDKFGLQLKAATAAPVLGGSESDLAAFLSRMPQMGQARAWKVIRSLGGREATLFALESDPAQLTKVSGITLERAEAISKMFNEKQGVADSLAFLSGLGLGERTVARAIDMWEGHARQEITDDPYVLMKLPTVGFRKADEIARTKLKVTHDDSRRCRAAAELAVSFAEDEGHVWSAQDELCGAGRTRLAKRIRDETALTPEALARGLDLATCIDTLGRKKRLPYVVRRQKADIATEESHLCGDTTRIWSASIDSAEQDIAEHLARLMHASDGNDSLIVPDGLWGDLSPAPEQAEAVNAIASNRVMVITGGPGVGKTATTAAVLETLEHNKLTVGCCAPTGKAAKRMTEQTGAEALTIHRLLKYVPEVGFRHDDGFPESDTAGRWVRGGPVDFGAVIVDEASMVDVGLFAALLKAVPTGARLIIVGDVDQLPSIGAGQVLHDIIESGTVPVCKLSRIFRQAEESRIPYVARDINTGRPPNLGAGGDVKFIAEENPESIVHCIIQAATSVLPVEKADRRAFQTGEIQVLAAQKTGPAGVEALNRALQTALNPRPEKGLFIGGQYTAKTGDRVIHVKNNYELEVYNGEMGTVTAADFRGISVSALYDLKVDLGKSQAKDYVLVVDYGDRSVAYRKTDLSELLLGYAITVHKAQGSQFPAVLMPVHESQGYMLTRSLLYTGLTRASEFIVLFGQAKQVVMSARNTRGTGRRTTLQERLLQCMS